MRILCNVKLSPHRYKTPEGYLYCKDAIIARTGPQTYLKSEIIEGSDSDEYIDVDRKPEEVFSEKTMASFEKKPLTIDHPSVSVGPENYKDLAVGHIENVHKGEFEGQPVMLADIIVNDAEAIALIESGEMVELSCGYDCDITSGDNPEQINIRGNHVALCEQGRAGIARIQDSKKWGAKSINDGVSKGTLIQEFGKQGKQYKISKIVGNVIYAESLENGKNFLFKKDEENIEWAIISKSEVRDAFERKNVNMTEEQVKEEFKNDPRLQWGLNFHHENGKVYPVKERTKSQIVKALKEYYDVNIVEKPKEKDEFKYVEGTQGISDMNGNIYAYFLDRNGSYHRFVIADYEDYIDEIKPSFEDAMPKHYIIALRGGKDESTWLDENDKPTNDFNKARKFETYEEADSHRKTYCKGSVQEIRDTKVVDSKLNKEEFEKIKELLEEVEYKEPIEYNDEYRVITIKFPDKKELGKASKKLVNLYNIELNKENENEDYSIKLYEKFDEQRNKSLMKDSEQKYRVRSFSYARGKDFIICEDETFEDAKKIFDEHVESCKNQNKNGSFPTEYLVYLEEDKDNGKITQFCKIIKKGQIIKDSDDKWTGYDLLRGPASKEFKSYLRDRGFYFEPSENGRYVHFEVKNADKFVGQRAEDIRNHWAQFGDSYSRKFYIKSIEALEDKLKKLEKNEILDENNKDYELQKNKMRETIKKQIEEYKAKLKNE